MKIISIQPKFDGKQLKILAIQKNLPLWKLAQGCGVQPSRISDYVNGRRKPSEQTLKRIADFLNEDPASFLSIDISERSS